MFNSIRLVHGIGVVSRRGEAYIESGEPVKCWPIEEKDKAYTELANHRCTYSKGDKKKAHADEWALEFCELDEEGMFVDGSDFSPAEVKHADIIISRNDIESAFYNDGRSFRLPNVRGIESWGKHGWFEAELADESGNLCTVYWAVSSSWDGEDDENACDWEHPNAVINRFLNENVLGNARVMMV